MYLGYTVQLYPTQEQALLLQRHFGCCRWLYNQMIEISGKRYGRTGKSMSGFDMQNLIPKLKKQYPWLGEVNAQSLQIVCHDLGKAYRSFFRKTAAFPKHKKKSHGGSFTAVTNTAILERHIKLPKLGRVRFRGGDCPIGKLKRITVFEQAGKYFASSLVDTLTDAPVEKPFDTVTGLDLGIHSFIATSRGEKFDGLRIMRKSCAKLRQASKALSRKQKGSARRSRARKVLARIHLKVANQRKDAHHKISHSLIANSENQAFAVEDLNTRGMMTNRRLARQIADCGWSQFLGFLKYKAATVGKPVLMAGRFYPSSKTCSACGVVNTGLTLSNRSWTCGCGANHDRDINAAINISKTARNAVRGEDASPGFALAILSETRMSDLTCVSSKG